MVKRTEEKIQKERVSIVVSHEARKHLAFIALEKDLSTPGEAIEYCLTFFDRTGKLKKQRPDEPQGEKISEKMIAGTIPEYAI